MRLPRRPRRIPADSAVPMINVVFLLLIFFMMAARIAPPLPQDLRLPQAQVDNAPPVDRSLSVLHDGTLAMAGATGDAAWQALAALPARSQLTVHADADLPAVDHGSRPGAAVGTGVGGRATGGPPAMKGSVEFSLFLGVAAAAHLAIWQGAAGPGPVRDCGGRRRAGHAERGRRRCGILCGIGMPRPTSAPGTAPAHLPAPVGRSGGGNPRALRFSPRATPAPDATGGARAGHRRCARHRHAAAATTADGDAPHTATEIRRPRIRRTDRAAQSRLIARPGRHGGSTDGCPRRLRRRAFRRSGGDLALGQGDPAQHRTPEALSPRQPRRRAGRRRADRHPHRDAVRSACRPQFGPCRT